MEYQIDLINELINTYLNKFYINFQNIDQEEWEKYQYNIYGISEEDIYMDLIQDIAKIISNIIYDSNCSFDFNNKNKIYIFNNNKTINNLISWKIISKTNNNRILLIRYGIFGNTRYIRLHINLIKYLLNETKTL